LLFKRNLKWFWTGQGLGPVFLKKLTFKGYFARDRYQAKGGNAGLADRVIAHFFVLNRHPDENRGLENLLRSRPLGTGFRRHDGSKAKLDVITQPVWVLFPLENRRHEAGGVLKKIPDLLDKAEYFR
jgi:hypothetical protein